MPVIIVGMHRSGTSLLAGLLKIAGCAFGPESSLMPALEQNPKGFFENLHFLEFNDLILEHFGGTWYDPPTLPPGWLDKDPAPMWIESARRVVDEQFGVDGQWAWKEPRTSLLLPFWRSIVPGAKVVLCVRNPLDVAGSLGKRNGFVLEHSVALWHLYTLQALVDTEPADLEVVFYDDLLQDHRSTLKRVFEFVGLNPADASWTEIDEFISKDLRHHEHSGDDLNRSPRVMCSVKDLYRSLRARDTAAALQHIRETPEVMPACREVTHDLRPYYEAWFKYDVMEKTLDTRPHRLATQFSRLANRTPAVAELLRKIWR